MNQIRNRIRFEALALIALAACGAISSSNYSGQPLATIHGTVNNASGSTPSHPAIAILWQNFDINVQAYYPDSGFIAELTAWANDGGEMNSWLTYFDGGPLPIPTGYESAIKAYSVGQVTSLSATTFPANFSIELFDPPPAQAFEFDSGIAFGRLVAIDEVGDPGTLGVNTNTLTLTCSADAGWNCLPSPDAGLAMYGGCNQKGETATCVYQIATIAPPNVFLGSAADDVLYYLSVGVDAGGAIFNGELLATPGYHVLEGCELLPTNPAYAAQAMEFESTPGFESYLASQPPLSDDLVLPESATVSVSLDDAYPPYWSFFPRANQIAAFPGCPGN